MGLVVNKLARIAWAVLNNRVRQSGSKAGSQLRRYHPTAFNSLF
jgi:hypothetical protein